ncbi:MAG: Hsp20/alpha crystallin family protein [Nannocystaceae bacterium]
MFQYFRDPHDPFRTFDLLRARLDQALRDLDENTARPRPIWPRVNLYDRGDTYEVQAEIPGVDEKDLELSATGESLTIKGERKAASLEGYTVHRSERGAFRFARTVALPAKIDVSGVSAALKDGILTVTLPKRPESKPRSITVKAQA